MIFLKTCHRISWLSGPLFCLSLLTGAMFVAWIFWDHGNEWNSVTKVEAAERTECTASFDEYPNCRNQDGSDTPCFYLDQSGERSKLIFPDNCSQECLNVYSECANGFILWVGVRAMSSFSVEYVIDSWPC